MVDIMVLQEVHRRAASEATSGALPQSSGRPPPPKSVLRKPFDRLSEVALTEEALPDSGAGLLLGDKELSLREHCAALACVSGGEKSFCSRVLKRYPLQGAVEAAIDVNSPPWWHARLAGRNSSAHRCTLSGWLHLRPLPSLDAPGPWPPTASPRIGAPLRIGRTGGCQQRHKEGSSGPGTIPGGTPTPANVS